MPAKTQTSDLSRYLSANAVQNVNNWLTQPKYGEYRDELEQMITEERWQDLEDAFFKVIEFGTAGRRGIVGIGSNRINRVTMGESAQALCQYALKADPDAASKGVVIACDTRLSSPGLSAYVASVCAANGFKTYIFDSFRSTPELSFAVRELGCAVGIVISASHNPPSDNGFKAYWDDGGQVLNIHAEGILTEAERIETIKSVDWGEAVRSGAISIIGDEVDTAYLEAVVSEAEGHERDVYIIYSPLHGAGQRNTLPALRAAGFKNVSVVEAQMTPDGNFPTIENGKPNPEERAANDRAVAQMMAEGADIAITNDPDADRIGVIVRHNDAPVYLSGNQAGILATEYALRKKAEKNQLTSQHFIAKTIVTTDMLDALAVKFGAACYGDLLIGFKYISEVIRTRETVGDQFVIGVEESFGLLKGSYARDKDGAAGALPLAEYAAELKKDNKTLIDRLYELYSEYGLYLERLDTIVFPGADGFAKMQHIMNNLREKPPLQIENCKITAVLDYTNLEKRYLSGETEKITGEAGNIVVLEVNGDSRCRFTVRPSGTEPKIKVYTQWYEASSNDVITQSVDLETRLEGYSRTLEGLLKSE